MLRNPPSAVEDDAPSQAWLEGLTTMMDYVLRCHGAASVAGGGRPRQVEDLPLGDFAPRDLKQTLMGLHR